MNLNGVFSYGSAVNVIVRAITTTTLGNKTFQAGEPVLFLKDVNINFNQSVSNPTSTQGGKVLLAEQQNYPSSLTLYNISLREKILDLLLSYNGEEEYVSDMITLQVDKDNSEYYFANDNIKNIYCYENGSLLESTKYTYNSTTNTITFNFNDEDSHYLYVFYEYKVNGLSYLFKNPNLPYFLIETSGKGNNSDSGNANVSMIFHKCKINNNYRFNSENSTNKQTLSFQIVYDNRDKIILY